jgi:hypothetical protein
MKSGRPLRRTPALLALTLLCACEGATVPDPERGTLVGRWAGNLWVGDASGYLQKGTPEGDVLSIFASKPRGGAYSEEVLSVRVVFRGPGTYPLGPEDVYFLELVGGDVVSAEYNGWGTPAGVLRITRFDGVGGVIEGELEFRATTQSTFASYGLTARLNDGKFRAIDQTPMLRRSP